LQIVNKTTALIITTFHLER